MTWSLRKETTTFHDLPSNWLPWILVCIRAVQKNDGCLRCPLVVWNACFQVTWRGPVTTQQLAQVRFQTQKCGLQARHPGGNWGDRNLRPAHAHLGGAVPGVGACGTASIHFRSICRPALHSPRSQVFGTMLVGGVWRGRVSWCSFWGTLLTPQWSGCVCKTAHQYVR